jgi:DnaK suppressor protein
MPVKKTASKKRKKVSTSRKKAPAKKAAARKTVAKKRKVTKKKRPVSRKKKAAPKKKSAKKKPASKKKAASKKASRKKPAARKVSKKKSAARKVSKKKSAARKVSKKKSAARKVHKKKSAARKVSRKKTAPKKKVSKKKLAARKATVRKKPVARKATVRKKPVAKKAPARRAPPRGNLLSGPIHGISPYKPGRREEYMSGDQLDHFREILSAWKSELIVEVDRTVHHMQDEAANFPDPNDRATQESEFGLELRTRDRERKLLRKIDSALVRIDDSSYGYCEETGEEIGLKRLEARPVATLCVEAQERRELAERQFRDRDDRYR